MGQYVGRMCMSIVTSEFVEDVDMYLDRIDLNHAKSLA
jgi:hypothetical protein